MHWPIGSTVVVRTLGGKRGVVADARGGRYRVRVEGVTVWCREDDLAALAGSGKRSSKRKTAERSQRPDAAAAPAGRVDLHGLRVDEALARVDEEINRALLSGADRVEIVHGRGTGRLRTALHRHLSSLSVVSAFRLDASNPGVTWVHF